MSTKSLLRLEDRLTLPQVETWTQAKGIPGYGNCPYVSDESYRQAEKGVRNWETGMEPTLKKALPTIAQRLASAEKRTRYLSVSGQGAVRWRAATVMAGAGESIRGGFKIGRAYSCAEGSRRTRER